ncbi:hypothetical protein MGN70_000695 [Eutypa lata]|nr:hypothetical protein MGN70_000695 [Eutypa lata]
MDPLSLATACVTLIDAAAKTSTGIITFVHSYHEARSDLTTINNELSELRTVLELLKDTVVKTIDSVIPERLQARVVSIIDNCVAVVTKIDDILDRHRGGLGAAKWAVAGKMEIAGLRTGLEAHRQSLHLALELVSITLVKTVKDDTAVIRMEVHDMRENAYQIPEIMQELAKIRAFISGNDSTSADVVWEDTDSGYRDDMRPPIMEVGTEIPPLFTSSSNTDPLKHQNDHSTNPQSRQVGPTTLLPPGESQQNFTCQNHRQGVCGPPEKGNDVHHPELKDDVQQRDAHGTIVPAPRREPSSKTAVTKNVAVTGDPGCGKSAMILYSTKGRPAKANLLSYIRRVPTSTFPQHNPTYQMHDDTRVKLRLWDNLETFPDISPLYYDAHHFDMFQHWRPSVFGKRQGQEITQFCPDTPIFLVGLKSDLRDDHRTIKKLKRSSQQPVSSGDAEACQESIGARKYFECSALTGHGVNELLRSVAQESAATRGVLDKVVRNRRI